MKDISSALVSRDRLGLIGAPGYSLPLDGEFDVFDIAAYHAAPTIEKLSVVGAIVPDTGLIVLSKSHGLRAPVILTFGHGARDTLVFIGSSCTLHGAFGFASHHQTAILAGGVPDGGHTGEINVRVWSPHNLFYIGAATTSNGAHFILSGEQTSIVVGDDVMLSSNVYFRTDDQHAILDMSSGERVNLARSVVVEPHVWVGQNVLVLKGAVLGLGSVIGAASLVLADCPRFSVCGGSPARVIAAERTWDRQTHPQPGTIPRLRELARQVRPAVLAP